MSKLMPGHSKKNPPTANNSSNQYAFYLLGEQAERGTWIRDINN